MASSQMALDEMMSPFRKIRALLTPAERKSASVLFGLMVIGMALETLCTGLVIPAIALMTQQDLAANYPQLKPLMTRVGGRSQGELVLLTMLVVVAIYLVKNLFLAYLAWSQTRFAFGVQAHMSQRLFKFYLAQPYTFHLQRNSAELIRNAISEVAMFSVAMVSVLGLLTELLVFVGISCLLLAIEPLGALLAAFVLSLAAWAFHRSTRGRIVQWGESRQHHDGLRMQHLQQGLGGAKDVKLLGREAEFLAQFQEHNFKSAQVSQFQATLQQLPRLWLELLAVMGLAALVIAMLAQERSVASIVPTLGLFAAAAFRLMPSVNRMLAAVQSLRYSVPAIDTVHGELLLLNAEQAEPKPFRRRQTFGVKLRSDIRLRAVRFTYPSAHMPALDGISVLIRKGESVGFVGPSGSGKSTLVDTILGLLTPESGNVIVDGKSIHENIRAWQDQIGYVPQSIYLTDDTLRRNVAFGLSDDAIDDDAVRRAIRAAQLEEFVGGLPEGLQTIVGERGVRLSGGQRQRIGIARALYHDPGVLVLDEATSALDSATERDVMQAVNALHGSKTILIVAHRLSTVEHCDRLYQLDQGRVVAEGPPAGMLRVSRAV